MAKNKSVAQVASLDNKAVGTNYQVKAQPVDTFVRGPSNTKGMQVAKALQQVSGSIDNYSTARAKRNKEEEIAQQRAEAKAYKGTVLREKSKANILSSGWVEKLESDAKNADLTKVTQAEWYTQWREDNPTFDENLSSFTTQEGQLKFATVVGEKLNEYFTSNQQEQQQYADSQLISEDVFTMSKSVKGLSINDPNFANFVKEAEDSMVGFGYASKKSRYEMLHHVAKKMYTKQNDQRLYQWLQGEADGRMPIGDPVFQESVVDSRRAIKTQINTKRNQDAADTAAALKVNQVKLAQDTSALLVSEGATRETKQELVEKYLKLGVGNAYKVVNDMAKNFETIKEVEIDIEDETKLWQGFLQAGSPEDQMLYIQTKVKNGELTDKGLAAQFYSRVGNADDKALLSSVHVKAYDKWLTQLTQSMDDDFGMVDDAKYAYLKPLFVRRMLTLGMSPEWAEMDDNARWGAMKDLTLALEDLKGSNDKNPNNDMQSLEQKRLMFKSARMKEEGANEAKRAEIKKKADALQVRINALKNQ